MSDDAGVPLTDLPVDYLLEQMVRPQRQQQVGQRFRIAHLTSAKGMTLNGKICTVRGFDTETVEARLHCEVENESVLKLKFTNLVPLDACILEQYMEKSPPIPDEELLVRLERSIIKHDDPNIDREDLKHRLELYKTLTKKLRNKETLTDADYIFPCGAGVELLGGDDNPYAVLMSTMKPACTGNMCMDMRYLNLGLSGDGHTQCSICSDVLAVSQTEIFVTLPCFHVFHDKCLVDWLESDLGAHNWNCPECRAPVPDEMATYRNLYEEQVQRRFDEFPLSGFCTKCMMYVMERNRNQELPM
jgi:hypothetical protein